MSTSYEAQAEKAELPKLGVPLDVLSDDVLRAVVGIYYEVARGEMADPATLTNSFFCERHRSSIWWYRI